MIEKIISFFIGIILIMNFAVGIAFFSELYKKRFTILAAIRGLLFAPLWFLFWDELKYRR